jgi:type II secretory pathway pseudopilin PulG
MKMVINDFGRRTPGKRAFTLVEIAICLGIIGFALVAIIGILPAGLQVQRDNKEDTIINQEGTFLLDAIRSGAEELTNLAERVDSIELKNIDTGYIQNVMTSAPREVVGRLSTPTEYETNEVQAIFRAGSGPLGDAQSEVGFRYKVIIRNYPCLTSSPNNPVLVRNAVSNQLRDIRLDVRWPVLANGKLGTGRQLFRSQASGTLVPDPVAANQTYRFWFLRQ